MFSRETWGEILQSIGKNKLRTVLTGFAVFWGIFMLILLLGLGAGLKNGFAYNFRNTAENSISIWGGETSKPWNGLPTNRQIQLDEEDVETLRNAVPGVINISGSYRVWRGNSRLQRGDKYGSYNIHGVVSEHQQLEKQIMDRGRFINEVDEQEKRKVIVIAEDARKELFAKEEEPLGEWLNVNGVPFQGSGLVQVRERGSPRHDGTQPGIHPVERGTTGLQCAARCGRDHVQFLRRQCSGRRHGRAARHQCDRAAPQFRPHR